MDRDFTVFANFKHELPPLGAKKARLFSGWAKTETSPGVYSWAWLDEIIPAIHAMEIEPWVCLSYGNPIYAGGGTRDRDSPLPSGEARAAWLAFVKAFITRYAAYVDEWEVWNEPLYQKITLDEYTEFYIQTAEAIREVQPGARILALSAAGSSADTVEDFLAGLREAGKLSLVDEITYHPYKPNPDSSYESVGKLRETVQRYSPAIRVRQGENGAPSEPGKAGALKEHTWTERSQAKWALRRLLGDNARGIESSYFSLIDMWYDKEGVNRKGLIYSPPDRTVGHRTEAYAAAQHLFSVFDAETVPDRSIEIRHQHVKSLAAYGYRRGTLPLVALWEKNTTPGVGDDLTPLSLTIAATYSKPVYVDLRTGAVSAFPAENWSSAGGTTTFRKVPVYDSPVLIAESEALMIKTP
jgi:hypothetical protein